MFPIECSGFPQIFNTTTSRRRFLILIVNSVVRINVVAAIVAV